MIYSKKEKAAATTNSNRRPDRGTSHQKFKLSIPILGLKFKYRSKERTYMHKVHRATIEVSEMTSLPYNTVLTLTAKVLRAQSEGKRYAECKQILSDGMSDYYSQIAKNTEN